MVLAGKIPADKARIYGRNITIDPDKEHKLQFKRKHGIKIDEDEEINDKPHYPIIRYVYEDMPYEERMKMEKEALAEA